MNERNITSDRLLEVMCRHVGKENGVHIIDLVKEMTVMGVTDKEMPGLQRRVRKLIEQLRMEGLHICGHPNDGYYMAATAEELIATCEFLYARVKTTVRQIARMRGVAEPDLRGQLRLPT